MAVIGEMLASWHGTRGAPAHAGDGEDAQFNPPLDEMDAAASSSKIIAEHLEARRAGGADRRLRAGPRRGAGRPVSHDELISTVMLLGAGFETTTNLIGNGLLALLDIPPSPASRDDRCS
jgi:cytochrome P450